MKGIEIMLEAWLFIDGKWSFVWRFVSERWSTYEWEYNKDWRPHWRWKMTIKRKSWYEVHEWTFSEWFLAKWIKTIVDAESTIIIEWNFKNKELDWLWKETMENTDWERCELEWNYKNWKLNWIWKTMYIKKDLDDDDMYVKIVYTWEFKDWIRCWKWKVVETDTLRDTKKSYEWTFVNWLPNWLCVIKDDEEEYTYKWEVKDGLPHWKWVKNYFYWVVEKWYFEFWELKNDSKLF